MSSVYISQCRASQFAIYFCCFYLTNGMSTNTTCSVLVILFGNYFGFGDELLYSCAKYLFSKHMFAQGSYHYTTTAINAQKKAKILTKHVLKVSCIKYVFLCFTSHNPFSLESAMMTSESIHFFPFSLEMDIL